MNIGIDKQQKDSAMIHNTIPIYKINKQKLTVNENNWLHTCKYNLLCVMAQTLQYFCVRRLSSILRQTYVKNKKHF